MGIANLTGMNRNLLTKESSMEKYIVIVGNIGEVYRGNNRGDADRTYREYVKQSKAIAGRASGEDVTLFGNLAPDILAEYHGRNEQF